MTRLIKLFAEAVGTSILERFFRGKLSPDQLRSVLPVKMASEIIKAHQDELARQKLGSR